MSTIRLTQWMVKTADGKKMAMFTPTSCEPVIAMAIATETFGKGVTALEDEGMVRVEVSEHAQSMKRDRFDAARDKRQALVAAEANGQVADSMEVREDLIRRMVAGEFGSGQAGLEECQRRLAAIKRTAKQRGMQTRNRVWRSA